MPLGVWCHNLSNADAAKVARIETSMTHSHPTILHAAACYVLALKHLINHLGDREGAYQVAKEYAVTEGNGDNSTGNNDIQNWFTDLELEKAVFPPHDQVTWAKQGFIRAFRSLREGDTYEAAMRKTLGTDGSDAAIVGGLVGAAVGVEGIPDSYTWKVDLYSFEKNGGVQRPAFLSQSQILPLTEKSTTLPPLPSLLRYQLSFLPSTTQLPFPRPNQQLSEQCWAL